MKYQVLFSLKNNEKEFMNIVCWSRDWRFKGLVAVILPLKVYPFTLAKNYWGISTGTFKRLS